jgi:hypothetical protein
LVLSITGLGIGPNVHLPRERNTDNGPSARHSRDGDTIGNEWSTTRESYGCCCCCAGVLVRLPLMVRIRILHSSSIPPLPVLCWVGGGRTRPGGIVVRLAPLLRSAGPKTAGSFAAGRQKKSYFGTETHQSIDQSINRNANSMIVSLHRWDQISNAIARENGDVNKENAVWNDNGWCRLSHPSS